MSILELLPGIFWFGFLMFMLGFCFASRRKLLDRFGKLLNEEGRQPCDESLRS